MKSFEIIEMGSFYRRDLFFLVYMTFVSSFFFFPVLPLSQVRVDIGRNLENIDRTWFWVITATLVLFFLIWKEILKSEGFTMLYEAIVKHNPLAESTSFGKK